MKKTVIGFMGFAEPFWDRDYISEKYEYAERKLTELAGLNDATVITSGALVFSADDLQRAGEKMIAEGIEGLVVHTTSFTAGELVLDLAELLKRYPVPLI